MFVPSFDEAAKNPLQPTSESGQKRDNMLHCLFCATHTGPHEQAGDVMVGTGFSMEKSQLG